MEKPQRVIPGVDGGRCPGLDRRAYRSLAHRSPRALHEQTLKVSGQPKGDQPQRSASDYVGAFEDEGPRRGGAWQPVNRRCREQIHLNEQG